MSPVVLNLVLLAAPAGTDPAPPSALAPALASSPTAAPAPDSPSRPPAAPPPASAEETRRSAENKAIIRMAERESPDAPLLSDASGRGLVGAFIRMLVVLGAVCALAYLLLGKVLPRLMRGHLPEAPQRILKVVDRVPLDQRASLLVVAVGEAYFLVGASQGGIHLISRLEADTVAAAFERAPSPPPKLSTWAQALLTRRQKER